MLNPTQRRILAEICRNGGQYKSIFRLSIQLNIHYATALRNVKALRVSGHIRLEIKDGQGHPAHIFLPCEKGDEKYIPSWWITEQSQGPETAGPEQ